MERCSRTAIRRPLCTEHFREANAQSSEYAAFESAMICQKHILMDNSGEDAKGWMRCCEPRSASRPRNVLS